MKSIAIIGFMSVLASLAMACAAWYPWAYIYRYDRSVIEGQTAFFNGAGGTNDGGTASYKWQFPPQAYDIQGANTTKARCRFNSAGSYKVYFTVRSSTGRSTTTSCTVSVTEYVPVLWYVSVDGDDVNNDGLSPESPFQTIPKAIDEASYLDRIIVLPGTHEITSLLNFGSKSLHLTGSDPEDPNIVDNTIIQMATGYYNVNIIEFDELKQLDSTLSGLTFKGGNSGLVCNRYALDSVTNCRFWDCATGVTAYYQEAPLVMTGCMVLDTAGYNGISVYGPGGVKLINCVIAGSYENGIEFSSASESESSILNCTIVNNGRGIMRPPTGMPITNSIIWGNMFDQIYCYGESPSVTYCCIQDTAPGGSVPFEGAANHNIDLDPCFVNRYSLGGPDQILGTRDDGLTFVPNSSPCIDTGLNTAMTAEGIDTDIMGSPRIKDGDVNGTDTVDMGAYEARCRIYVDDHAAGSNNGSSWTDAFTDLQSALNKAVADDEIWAAAGQQAYKPTVKVDPQDDRSATFQLKEDVSVYGGFDPASGDDEWSERNPVGNITILSGDIGTVGVYADNSYHVVLGADNALLDGFTIAKGCASVYASGDGGGLFNENCTGLTVKNCVLRDNLANDYGGGLYNSQGQVTVINCTFVDNEADYGGGFYNSQGRLSVTRCTFVDNTAWSGGGIESFEGTVDVVNGFFAGNRASAHGGAVFSSDDQQMTFTNCVFTGNSCDYHGGGVYNDQSDSVITNCTFSGNSVEETGAGVYNGSSSPVITNSIFWGNTANGISADETSQIYTGGGSPVIAYCCVQDTAPGGTLPFNGGVNHNIDTDPCFIDADGADNIYGTEDDGLYLPETSLCVDSGNDDLVPSDLYDLDDDGDVLEKIPYDLLGNRRLVSDVGTISAVDRGAYEFRREIAEAHFSGSIVGGQRIRGFISKAFSANESSDILYAGSYPVFSSGAPKAYNGSFDGLILRSETRLIIYPEVDFGGDPIIDVTGPVVINNWDRRNDYNYGTIYSDMINWDWPEPLQSEFPLSVRLWSDDASLNVNGSEDMWGTSTSWDTGSFEITAVNVELELETSSTTGGSVSYPGEGTYGYHPTQIVPVSASPESGYVFSHWSGTAVDAGKVANPSAASTTVRMDDHYTLVANFSPNIVSNGDFSNGSAYWYTSGPEVTIDGVATIAGSGYFSQELTELTESETYLVSFEYTLDGAASYTFTGNNAGRNIPSGSGVIEIELVAGSLFVNNCIAFTLYGEVSLIIDNVSVREIF